MEVQRIRTEGYMPNLRDVSRVWIEVVAVPVNGVAIEGHRVDGPTVTEDGTLVPNPVRIEVYSDRLADIAKLVRTKAHYAKHDAAVEMNKHAVEEWIRENRASVEAQPASERAKFIDLRCNLRPEVHYGLVGLRAGMPPLESCKVLHPQADQSMELDAFLALSAQDRASWLVEPPLTPMNAGPRSTEHLAEVLREVLTRRDQGGNNKR